MHVGVHLPQYGKAAGPDAIARAARHAEALGFADVWVSDHLVHPAEQDYPSPYLYDPLMTLCWAAAVTDRVGLGTSVLVAPHHGALELANTLASLDALSRGRLTLGIGVGWSAREFEALGQSFHDRGRRTDEIIDLLHACWRDDPVDFTSEHYRLDKIRVLPKPAHPIAIWIGGRGEPAYRRAVTRGDGFQAIGLDPAQAAVAVARIRRDRPDPAFTISLRTGWDPRGMDPGLIREECAAYDEAGIQHVVTAPWRNDLDAWLGSMDDLAAIVL
jgi:probable F420-dependent oxidoreductase